MSRAFAKNLLKIEKIWEVRRNFDMIKGGGLQKSSFFEKTLDKHPEKCYNAYRKQSNEHKKTNNECNLQ
jgi:hypothetical protein